MANKKCLSPNCERESISHSSFCGTHTNNRSLRKTIRQFKNDSFVDVFWDEVELKDIVFEKRHFAASTLSNIDLDNIHFINCGFSDCDFEHAVFTNCIFENCELEKCVFNDVTFQESTFNICEIIDCSFSEINLADESAFTNCNLESCEFSGGIFSETATNTRNRFYENNFTQFSISKTRFEQCQFTESRFSKSSFYDSAFINCHFNTISHDFKLSGPPMLCDFSGSDFINMSIPKSFKTWNNFKQTPIDFYLKTTHRLLADDHPNHLKELSLALQHLENYPEVDVFSLRTDLTSLFRKLLSAAAQAANYEIIGEILTAFGRIPEKFRQHTGFFLPPATETGNLQNDNSRLSIHVSLDQWTVKRVSAFLSLMNEMEKALPEGMAQEIESIEKGSLIIEIIGSLKPLLAYFQTLLSIRNSSYELKLKALELESKKTELEYQRQFKELEIKKSMLDLDAKQLQFDKEKLELMKAIKEASGYDHLKFIQSGTGKKAQKTAEIMQAEFPILHLRLEE